QNSARTISSFAYWHRGHQMPVRLCGRLNISGEIVMVAQRRIFFLIMMTLATAATPAGGQAVTHAVERSGGGAPIPDFSGIWGHPYWPGFEPPASGPGPVTNRSRLRGGPQAGVSSPGEFVGDYTNPILKPWAAEVLKKRGERELSGVSSPTAFNQCWPQGVPFIFFNFAMQML